MSKAVDLLSELVEENFPKGECKERGAAMVMAAQFLMWHRGQQNRQWVKAYIFGWSAGIIGLILGLFISGSIKIT